MEIMGTIDGDFEKEGQDIGTLAGVSPLGDTDIEPPHFLDWDEIKQPSYCHEGGTLYPFKALIEMVEYFELNPDNAED